MFWKELLNRFVACNWLYVKMFCSVLLFDVRNKLWVLIWSVPEVSLHIICLPGFVLYHFLPILQLHHRSDSPYFCHVSSLFLLLVDAVQIPDADGLMQYGHNIQPFIPWCKTSQWLSLTSRCAWSINFMYCWWYALNILGPWRLHLILC